MHRSIASKHCPRPSPAIFWCRYRGLSAAESSLSRSKRSSSPISFSAGLANRDGALGREARFGAVGFRCSIQAYFNGQTLLRSMRIPAIILNFKTYPEILGKKGWELAKRFAAVADDTRASIVLAPPTSDLAHIAKLVHIPVIGQHVDAVEPGQTTGWTPPEALLEAGAAREVIHPRQGKGSGGEMGQFVTRSRGLGLGGRA